MNSYVTCNVCICINRNRTVDIKITNVFKRVVKMRSCIKYRVENCKSVI